MANAKHSNGRLFRILTGSPYRIDKAIFSWFAGCDRQGNEQVKGDKTHTDGHSKKAAATLQRESLQPFFRNKKPQNPYLQILVFLPHLSSSPDLRIISSHTAFSDFSNDRLSSNVGASTHTVAVPSGIHTRFSILLWGCYRVHRHLNGIFTCTDSIHEYNANVNRKRRNINI